MPVLNLAAYKPQPATLGDANQIANGFDAIMAAVNSIDNTNFGAGKIFDPAKLMQNGAVDKQGLLWDAATSTWKPGTLTALTYRKTTAKIVNTTTSPSDLLNGEITLGAGDLGTTKLMRCSTRGDWLQNVGSSAVPRFQVVIGGTTVLDTGTGGGLALTAAATRHQWVCKIEILQLGATNSQVVSIELHVYNGGSTLGGAGGAFTTGTGFYTSFSTDTTVANGGFKAVGSAVSALDMTTSKTLVLNTINGSASASYETKLFGALVEIV